MQSFLLWRWINQAQPGMWIGKITVEISSAAPWKSKLFYWLCFNIVLVLPCRGFSYLHFLKRWGLTVYEEGGKDLWRTQLLSCWRQSLFLTLYFWITVEAYTASQAKASYSLSKSRQGCRQEEWASQSSQREEPEMLASGGTARVLSVPVEVLAFGETGRDSESLSWEVLRDTQDLEKALFTT